MKIAVYTAIFGDKDILRDPIKYQEVENIDYFLFTDNPLVESKIYKKLLKPILFKDITKNARYYKILGAPELEKYDFSIWHDGNLQIRSDKILDLIKCLGNSDLATFKHPLRNCIYLESIACIKRKKDSPRIIFKQITKYFKEGLQSDIGLYETSILVKRQKKIK